MTFASAKLAALAGKGLKVKVACAAACTASGTATADKATARKVGAKKIGAGKGKASAAGTATVTIKAPKKVARKLKRLKSAKATVKLVVKQGGKTQSLSRTLTLKR
jgi:hypothetical protein